MQPMLAKQLLRQQTLISHSRSTYAGADDMCLIAQHTIRYMYIHAATDD